MYLASGVKFPTIMNYTYGGDTVAWWIISILHANITPVFVGSFKYLNIQNINSLIMKYSEQIRKTINKTIYNPDLKIAPSPTGSQLKMSENLNSNEPLTPEAKMECSLQDLARLRSLTASNSTEEIFIHVHQEALTIAQTPPWSVST